MANMPSPLINLNLPLINLNLPASQVYMANMLANTKVRSILLPLPPPRRRHAAATPPPPLLLHLPRTRAHRCCCASSQAMISPSANYEPLMLPLAGGKKK